MANLSLRGINKIYPGNVHAVRDLDLDIADRDFVVLVGPSGCGKSTTLRMIAGLETITSGELRIDSRLVNRVPPERRDVAMVFQNYALYPHMTVYDNMSFGLRMRRASKPEIRRRVQAAAELLEISDLLNRKPAALSGGQRQRVALGRAIVREPRVFLMDEPLSNLDNKLRAQMRAELIKLHRRLESTFIYVTHDQTEAMTMGTRIAVMHEGRMQQCGTPHKLYNEPANLFTACFIGTPQMNIFAAHLRRSGDALCISLGGTSIPIAPEKARRIQPESAASVLLGVRPENIRIAAPDDGAALRARVEMTEQLGPETLLHLHAEGIPESFIIRAAPDCTLNTGDSLSVTIDAGRIHLFDPFTKISITK